MCSIIGIFNVQAAETLVLEGLKIMKARGRENHGISIEKEDKYSKTFEDLSIRTSLNAIGHNLHSVVSNVKQPLVGDGKFIANCEIYNWHELKEKYGLHCKNDSELLFWLFEKNILPDAIEELDGDYAFAYWKGDEVAIARDIVGVKPVWYSKKRQDQNCFAFASEKKALERMGFQEIEELNPRKILFYNLKENTLLVKERDFFEIEPEHNNGYDEIKNNVSNLLTDSVEKRIPDVKLGLLFSGGVDSSFLALTLKRLGVDFTCYVAGLDGDTEPEDITYAKKVAEALDLKLKIVTIKIDEVETYLKKIIPLIEDSNVVKVGVALPFYLCAEAAAKDGVKVIFSGLGSEEIFAGYERHKNSDNVNKECYSGLLKMYERDLYRDDVVTMANSIELRVPFLDRKLIEYCLKIPSKYKLVDEQNKWILRQVAKDAGLPEEFSERKKRAAQYGSRFDNAIKKLSKKNKFETKSDYLDTFYEKPNLRLGVLFSSGKDSAYAMYVTKKQNYEISCLITIKSQNPDSYMFHTPTIDVASQQAEAMGIPILIKETKGEEEKELDDLKAAIFEAKEKYKIEGIVTGALFSDYQRKRIESICDKLGLKCFSPLWHMNQEKEMREIINNGFRFIITKIAGEGFDESWLGKIITIEDVDRLAVLNKKFGINIAFEGGEAETLVLDGPIFKKKIRIIESEKIMEKKNTGVLKVKKIILE